MLSTEKKNYYIVRNIFIATFYCYYTYHDTTLTEVRFSISVRRNMYPLFDTYTHYMYA